MQDSGHVHSLWKIFNQLGHMAFCISASHQIIWMNAKAKQLFQIDDINIPFARLKKIFKREDEWLVSKCLLDALDGKFLHKNLQLNHKLYSSLDFHFCALDLGGDNQAALVLALEPTQSKSVDAQWDASESEILENAPVFMLDTFAKMGADYFVANSSTDKQLMLDFFKAIHSLADRQKQASLGEAIEALLGPMRLLFESKSINLKVCPTANLPKVSMPQCYVQVVLFDLLMQAFSVLTLVKDKSDLWVQIDVGETTDCVQLMVTNSTANSGLNASLEWKEKSQGQKLCEFFGGSLNSSPGHPNARFVVTFPKSVKKSAA